MLKETNYDKSETEFLVNGFKQGFDLQYKGPKFKKSRSKNLPITVGSKTVLWNKLMKEVSLKRVAGPYEDIPFEYYIQSPIGLVPKAGSDGTRLIFHLSYNFGEEEEEKSLNFHTPCDLCSVKYCDIDHAVQMML